MVSLQAALLLEEKKTPLDLDIFLSKKRKRRDGEDSSDENLLARDPKLLKAEADKEDVELNLDAPPLPLDWQRCLDIKSGRIHFYNTRTNRRTSMDPRLSLDPPPSPQLSLDLELNLTCEPPRAGDDGKTKKLEARGNICDDKEGDAGGAMVAAVCRRCHMLVMMSKAALLCPNCKFVHPSPDHNSPSAAKPASKLLCCED